MSVGLDLLEIGRLERAIERRPRLAERLFTERERSYAAARARPMEHLAARFCAKEAVSKALTMPAWNWHDIEVVSGPDGAPRVLLHGGAAERARALGVAIEISLTHTGADAGAVAVTVACGHCEISQSDISQKPEANAGPRVGPVDAS